MGKHINEADFTNIITMLDNGLKNDFIANMYELSPETVKQLRSLVNKVNKENMLTAEEATKRPKFLAAVESYYGKKAILPEAATKQTATTPAPPSAPKATDNTAVYLISLANKLTEISEQLANMMDADNPKHIERIVTAIEAGNTTFNEDKICSEIKSATSIIAQTIRDVMRTELREIVNIEKDNRNTLMAIKNSVQRMETKHK